MSEKTRRVPGRFVLLIGFTSRLLVLLHFVHFARSPKRPPARRLAAQQEDKQRGGGWAGADPWLATPQGGAHGSVVGSTTLPMGIS